MELISTPDSITNNLEMANILNNKYLLLLVFCVLNIQVFFAQAPDNRPTEKEVQTQKLFIEANKEKVLGNLDDAAYLFGEVIKKDKENNAAFYELSKIYMIQESFGKAKKNIQEAIALAPDNLWYNSLLGEVLEMNRDYKGAAEVYGKMAEIDPEEVGFLFQQAEMYRMDGKGDLAIKTFNQIESQTGVSRETTAAKYSVYMESNKPAKAALEIEKLIKANPTDTDFRLMLAEHYEAAGEKEKASTVYKEILKINPEDPLANLAMAETYQSKGDNTNYLHSLKGIFNNPEVNIDIKIQEIVPYIDMVGKSKDEAFIKEAVALTSLLTEAHEDEAKAFAVHGDMLNHANRPKAALAEYKKAVELNSSVFTVWEQILYINSALEQSDELIENSEMVMDLFPNQPLPYLFNGMANSQKGNHEDAVATFQQAAMMAGKNQQLKEQCYIQMGSSYHSLNKPEKSNEAFEKALIINDKNPLTLNNFSFFLAERGDRLDDAKRMAEQAITLEPKSASFLDTYGWVFYKLKNYKDAKKWIGKSLEEGGDKSPGILENYGDTLFQLNEIEEAVKYWQMAQQAGGTSAKLVKKIAARKIVE